MAYVFHTYLTVMAQMNVRMAMMNYTTVQDVKIMVCSNALQMAYAFLNHFIVMVKKTVTMVMMNCMNAIGARTIIVNLSAL